MSKGVTIVIAGILLIAAVATGAYFGGLWTPNRASRREFPVQGIDVSGHQGEIQWSRIPSRDVQFVYIKATEGGDFRDGRFVENWEGSRATGLRRGAYHYFTFRTPGATQAANFIATVPNDPAALPPAVDVEYWGNSSDRPTAAMFQHELAEYLAKVREQYGVEPLIYTAREFQSRYLEGFPQPRLWFRTVVTSPRVLGISNWTFWQYSEKERVPGITGFVDRNVFHGTPEQFTAFCNRRL